MKRFLSSILALQLMAAPGAVFAAQQTSTSAGTKYTVVSNESTDTTATEFTGTFNVKNIKYSLKGIANPSSYKIDYIKPFNPSSFQGKLTRKSIASTPKVYNVGDSKSFWVSDLTSGSYSQITSRLAYSGVKANVWVYNNEITDDDAAKLGQEFDNKIYSTVTNNFGTESDVNHDGKVDILCYDIQDGYDGSGAYVAGYFDAEDLYNTPTSNQSEIFYIDTYPTMGDSATKDVTQVYSTLAHEFQHMVNYNQKVLVEGNTSGTDTWLDEGLSMAAEQIYEGSGLSDRLDYYNSSSAIQNGQSLLYWDDSGDVLSNYALSYLFLQYVKLQAGIGDAIFKEILQDPNTNYKAIEDVAKKYIDPNMTFGKLMTDFRIALLLKQPTGLYGFKGDPFFDGLQDQIFTGSSANLLGGGAVVTGAAASSVPADKGADISYHVFDVSSVTPASPLVNPVGDADTNITGTASADTVYAMAGQTQIGSITNVNGNFSFSIPKLKAGTVIEIYAKNSAGNISPPTYVTVKDVTAPAPPTVQDVSDSDVIVTGQTEANATVNVTASGVSVGTGTARGDGKFTITLSSIQKAGTILKITAADPAGNTSSPCTITVKAALKGWVYQNGTWYYYVSGKKVTGWLMSGTKWYYLDGSGAMKTGWLKDGSSWYYLNASGAMATGWLKSGTKWYYLDGSGVMKTGWLKYSGGWYYLNSSGAMATGWLKLGTVWYYFDSSGVMKTGWVTISGKRYYFNSSGVWVK